MRCSWMAVALVCATAGCAAPRYLARVNDDVVDGQDLKAEFKRRHGGHQRFLTADEDIVRRFLDASIDRRLLLQEAYRLGLDEAPDIRASTAEFRVGKLVQRLVQLEIEEKAVPTEQEIQAAYDTRTEDIYLVREIVVKDRAAADGVVAALAGGADFEALARERSTAESRKYGGLVPEVAWGARTPEWEAAVFALAAGKVTPVLETEAGYTLVRLESKRKAEKPEFGKAAPRLRAILQHRKTLERRREFLDALWKKYAASTVPFDRDLATLRAARDTKDPRPVARWTGGALTLGEFAASVDLDAAARFPAERLAMALDDEVRSTMHERLVRAEAEARGDALLTAEAARAVRDHREGLIENRLLGEHVFREVTVTDEDLRSYYAAHAQEFTTEEARHVAHLVVESEDAVEAARRALASGTSFEDLARTRSTDAATAKSGGDLGWTTRKSTPGELAAIFDAKAGEVVGPFTTKAGKHLVKVLAIAPPRTPPLEEIAAEVRKKAVRAKNQERREAWVKQLRANANISVSDRGVRSFVMSEQAALSDMGKTAAPSSHGPQGHGPPGAGMPPPGAAPPAAGSADATPARKE